MGRTVRCAVVADLPLRLAWFNRDARAVSVCIFAAFFVWSSLFSGCSVQTQRRALTAPDKVGSLDRGSKYLKAHLRNGNVCILSDWEVGADQRSVTGVGKLLSINREVLGVGHYTILLDSVAIFETNVVRTSAAVQALAVVTGASVVATIFCMVNPKACFGSCPTFYVSDGKESRLQAEGFSASVSPSLEATDVDALYRAKPGSQTLEVQMRNEALETHVVRYVDALVARRPPGGRVFATADGKFREARGVIVPSRCVGAEGDCLEQVREFDGAERTSLTDSTRLDAKETIELAFDDVSDSPVGLVIACRQSLLSTYLFYQSLAYMGRSAGQWFAQLERSGTRARRLAGSIGRRLGGIEVLTRNDGGKWVRAGEVRETGPLASDVHLVPLPGRSHGSRQIRLVLTKGYWRVDYVALALLGGGVEALRIRPSAVLRDSLPVATALVTLRERTGALTTSPGDIYTMTYELPGNYQDYELFLESRGYYLEWMRDEWLAEENPQRATMMFRNPAEALRLLAPQFKAMESEIERQFWNSRYAR